jgi:hypothetical protein
MAEPATASFPRGLLPVELPAGADVIRVHRNTQGAIFFGPPRGTPPGNRFDAPRGEYRILYAAVELEGAFVETVLRNPRERILKREYVEQRGWTVLALKPTLKLAKLHENGLQFNGTDAGIIGADDYAESRALALALYQEHKTVHGLAYRSRYDNGQICYALFDRVAETDLSAVTADRFDAHRDRVKALMDYYGATFDSSVPIPDFDDLTS